MAWFYLIVAGMLEVAWAIAMKYSHGFTRPLPTVLAFITGLASFYLLTLAANQIPIGSAYAVWTGIGAVGTAALGMLLFAESHHPLRLASMALVIIGTAGLRLFSK